MKLEEFINRGAIYNPYSWYPGFFYCLSCKSYRHITAYILGLEERIFCAVCREDMSLDSDRNTRN